MVALFPGFLPMFRIEAPTQQQVEPPRVQGWLIFQACLPTANRFLPTAAGRWFERSPLRTTCGGFDQAFDVRLARRYCVDKASTKLLSLSKVALVSHLASVRLPSTWPATPRRQGDGQLSSPSASASSADSNPPASVKTVELAKTILTYTKRACGKGQDRHGMCG